MVDLRDSETTLIFLRIDKYKRGGGWKYLGKGVSQRENQEKKRVIATNIGVKRGYEIWKFGKKRKGVEAIAMTRNKERQGSGRHLLVWGEVAATQWKG